VKVSVKTGWREN